MPRDSGSLDTLLDSHGSTAALQAPFQWGRGPLLTLCAAPCGLRMSPGLGGAGTSGTRAQHVPDMEPAGENVAIPVPHHPCPV